MRASSKAALWVVTGLLGAGCSSLLGDFSLGTGGGSDASGDAPADQTMVDQGLDSAGDAAPEAAPDALSDVLAEAAADGPVGSMCEAGFLSCDAGCTSETDLRNCGACGHDCTNLPHVVGTLGCSSGECLFDGGACSPGYGICSTNPDNGCDTDFTQPAHCGSCANDCDAGAPFCQEDDGGTYACVLTCGTETKCGSSCYDTTSDPNHCGGCNPCAAVDGGTPVCSNSNCSGITCDSTHHSCPSGSGNYCASNYDPNNCGATCGSACAGPTVGTGMGGCNGVSCTIVCTGSDTFCAGTTGCYNLQSDANNCGACGHSCKTPLGGAGTCSKGMCKGAEIVSNVSGAVGIDMVNDGTNVYVLDPGSLGIYQASLVTAGSAFTILSRAAGASSAGSIDVVPYGTTSLIAFTQDQTYEGYLWVAEPSTTAVKAFTIVNDNTQASSTDTAIGIAFNPVANQPTAWVQTTYPGMGVFQMYDVSCTTSCNTAAGNWFELTAQGDPTAGTPGFKPVWGSANGVEYPFFLMNSTGILYGGQGVQIVTGLTEPDSLTSDGTYLYWVNYDYSNTSMPAIQRVAIPNPSTGTFPITPTAVGTVAGTLTVDPNVHRAGLATDGKYVYFTGNTTAGGPGIYYVPVGGGSIEQLVTVGQPAIVMTANTTAGPLVVYVDILNGATGVFEVPSPP